MCSLDADSMKTDGVVNSEEGCLKLYQDIDQMESCAD